MQKKRFSTPVLFAALVALALLVLLVAGPARGLVTAQSESGAAGEPWLSSAEPPAGTEAAQLSPPDTTVPDQLLPEAPTALISHRVVGSALKPRENDVNYTVSGGGGCTYVTGGDSFTVWNSPIWLPQGSVVDTLRIYYNDTSANNSTAWLTAYDLYGAIFDEWPVSTSGSSGNGFNDSDPINHTIDYSVYSYVLNWRPSTTGSSMQLCGFRIFYEPPPFGLNFFPTILEEASP